MTRNEARTRLLAVLRTADTATDPQAALDEIATIVGHRPDLCATRARQLDEIRQALTDHDDGHLAPGGLVYRVHRILNDHAPADYREPLTETGAVR